MVKSFRLFLLSLVALAGCQSVDLTGLVAPPGADADCRFLQSREMQWPGPVEADPDGYVFYVCTDVHVDRTTANFSRFSEALNADPQAVFALVLGDCIDAKNMMPLFASVVSDSEKPMYVTLGNHDTFFSQWNAFRDLVGPSAYCFEVRRGSARDLFISLDSAGGTLGRKQTQWLQTLLETERDGYDRCIVMTHTNIFKTDNTQTPSGNFPLEETLALTDLFSRRKVDLVLQGHDHSREDVMFRGVRYTTVGTLKDGCPRPEYARVTVSAGDIMLDWTEFGE